MTKPAERPQLDANQAEHFPANQINLRRRGAFTDNMKLPIHRWFRYSAGFSAEWCEEVIKLERPRTVLDPFAGSGTTLLAAQSCGVEAHGFEAHHFVTRVARAKLAWQTDVAEFEIASAEILKQSSLHTSAVNIAPTLLTKCFENSALGDLLALRSAFERYDFINESVRDLVWLAITAILRECSHVGTAQWQYILPNKTKSKVKSPKEAFLAKVSMMTMDMRSKTTSNSNIFIHSQDARHTLDDLPKGSVDLVVTSPPYPNNYDYADATRLEMTFWGEVDTWSQLHKAVRNKLVASCSQHASAERLELDEVLAAPILDPIRREITDVCRTLALEREQKAGKKTYHTMVAAYFRDLGSIWETLRYHVADGGSCYFVVGDSAPYGVYVPVDRWLGEMAVAAGFQSWTFEKFRDRNTKWKNRKHQVPLKEGLLRVEG